VAGADIDKRWKSSLGPSTRGTPLAPANMTGLTPPCSRNRSLIDTVLFRTPQIIETDGPAAGD